MRQLYISILLVFCVLGCVNTYIVGERSNNYSPQYNKFIRNENLKDSVYVVAFDYLKTVDGRKCIAYIGSDSTYHFFLIIPKIAKQGTILSFAVNKREFSPKDEFDIRQWNYKKAKREWLHFVE